MSIWYLYLDESGDLGFDYINKKPSKYFTITILAIEGGSTHQKLKSSVTKTLSRKLNHKRSKRTVSELKGTETTIEIKQYFFKLVKDIPFAVFAITLNKRKVFERLARDKERVYNYIARLVLDKIRLGNAKLQIELIVDKSKSQKQIKEFNQYIISQIKAKIDPSVPLNIRHENSKTQKGLQAADLFCWGIFRSYERKDNEWLEVFKNKVKYNDQYL